MTDQALNSVEKARARLRGIVTSDIFRAGITSLIILNAITLGVETFIEKGTTLHLSLIVLDSIILGIFTVEILTRIFAEGRDYVLNPWGIFDITVVGISLLALPGGIQALRAFRVLRTLRLITVYPRLQIVVSALLNAIPGITAVAVVLLLIVYISAIIATNLFGEAFPHWFGDLFRSMFTLFEIMTLEGWPDIAESVIEVYPHAWLFFVLYILVATLTLLNLFIAIIVNAMDNEDLGHHVDRDKDGVDDRLQARLDSIQADIKALSEQMKVQARS